MRRVFALAPLRAPSTFASHLRVLKPRASALASMLSTSAHAASAAPSSGGSKSGVRIESDTMGKVEVSNAVYWGAQTERSLNNFKIGGPAARMPIEIIRGA